MSDKKITYNLVKSRLIQIYHDAKTCCHFKTITSISIYVPVIMKVVYNRIFFRLFDIGFLNLIYVYKEKTGNFPIKSFLVIFT